MKHNETVQTHQLEDVIELDGFKLFVKIMGENRETPTVIMDAGYGDYSKAWTSIYPEIAKLTKVMVYDRAGLGKSEKSPNVRTSLEMVKELKGLLNKLGVEPPYILVGHSFGGVNVRLYASMFPGEAAGVVLVDSTPEDYKDRLLPTMPDKFQEAYHKQFIYEGTYDEFMESLNQVKTNRKHFGDVPLLVLSAGKKAFYSKESQEIWHDMQKELLDLSTKSELIIAQKSGHYIQHDEPEYVVNAIKKIIGESASKVK
ncbi:alpha/beta fold hydrolase [Bacillus songklensis]|uniref:Alpha/beta fold hydrolase n=1 Tax=Bacillus songklensis TaxID=1069116 RepID=A0ABV8B932_9BACI